jgi:hypothetical protein
MPESRIGETYAREVTDAVIARVAEAFPLVIASSTTHETGVWFTHVEFTPQEGGIPVWLTAHSDRSFVITAGDSFRWAAEFEPEFAAEQIEELVDEITRLALAGYTVVRRNRLLGPFSATTTDPSESSRLSAVTEDWQPWG